MSEHVYRRYAKHENKFSLVAMSWNQLLVWFDGIKLWGNYFISYSSIHSSLPFEGSQGGARACPGCLWAWSKFIKLLFRVDTLLLKCTKCERIWENNVNPGSGNRLQVSQQQQEQHSSDFTGCTSSILTCENSVASSLFYKTILKIQ